jgi:hypothetical protein
MRSWFLLGSLLMVLSALPIAAGPVVIAFEGFPDSTVLTTQYPDLTFSSTLILTAGIGLNEFDFPPHSGTNVASDNGGPISIIFGSPVLSFGGYFTYLLPLTITGFDALDNAVASATSAYANNLALSGEPGSSPNEFLQVAFAGGISRVLIGGDPAGGSFTLDDAEYTSAVPEPSTALLFTTALLALAFGGRQRQQR